MKDYCMVRYSMKDLWKIPYTDVSLKPVSAFFLMRNNRSIFTGSAGQMFVAMIKHGGVLAANYTWA